MEIVTFDHVKHIDKFFAMRHLARLESAQQDYILKRTREKIQNTLKDLAFDFEEEFEHLLHIQKELRELVQKHN